MQGDVTLPRPLPPVVPSDQLEGSNRPEHLGWRSILFGGIALFIVLAIVMLQTHNPNLYPTVVLIGSFLVPVSFVALLYDHLHWSRLTFEAITWAFVIGGILGVLGASLLEPLVLPRFLGEGDTLGLRGGLLVAAIEEGSKLVAVMFVARRMSHTGALDGLLLGTAVGMGFAALESTGYSFTVLFATGGNVIASLDETVLRAAIAPFGHGIWTGIVGAALFHSSDHRRWRLGPRVWLALALVVGLHGAWDGLHVGGVIGILGVPLSTSVVALSVVGVGAFAVVYRAASRAQGARLGTEAPLSSG
jgi:protease PrsW